MSRPVDPRLYRQVPAVRRLLRSLVAVDAVSAALVVAQAVVLADVVVTVFGGTATLPGVAGRLTALAAIGLGRAATAAAAEWVSARASLSVRAELRSRALAAIVRLGPLWARRQQPGRLVSATGPGLDALDGYVTRALPAFTAAAIVPVTALAAIVWTDWQCGVILLALLPLVPLFMALVGLTTRRLVRREYAALERLSAQFLDLLRGLRTLRIYGRDGAQEATLRRITDDLRRRTVATLRVAFLSGLVLDLVAALSIAVVAVDIGLRLDGGHVSFAAALTVLLLAPEVFAPFRAMGAQHHAAEEGSAAASAALDIVDEAAGLPLPAEGEPASVASRTGTLTLEGVAVTYPDRSGATLRDASLTLHRGQVVALTGRSGAGKSTLLGVLLGAVPFTGRVADGGTPLTAAAAGGWRAGVAWSPQRPRPTQRSVGEEVSLGDTGADPAAVYAACRDCAAPDPSTPLGEDGLGISAGQRRRIALARALLRARAVRAAGGVPLVLLDEPSEDLDAATEAVVAGVVDHLRGWATVVLATHSATLVDVADRQIALAGGRVVADTQQHPTPAPLAIPAPACPPGPLPTSPVPMPPTTPAPSSPRLRALVRAAGARRRLLVAASFSALTALSGLGLTAAAMWLISRAAQHPNVQALAVAVVGVRMFAIGRAVLRYLERLATHDGALAVLAQLRFEIFRGLRSLDPGALARFGRGDLLRRFVGDVDGAQEGLARAVVPAGGALAGAVAATAVAAWLVPLAGLLLGSALLLAGCAVPLAAFRGAGGGRELVTLAGERDRRAAALVDGLDELTAYGRARAAADDVAGTDGRIARAARRPALAAALGAGGSGLVAAIALPAVLAAAVPAVASGRLSGVNTGVLAVCVLTGFEAVAALPAALVAWQRCRAGLRRVAELTGPAGDRPVDARPPSAEAPQPAGVPELTGALGLAARNLTVAPARDAPAVLTADFALPPGCRLAVVGPSGCGKTTLLAATMRMAAVRGGALHVVGDSTRTALDDLPPHRLPAAVAGSLQGDHVFDSTLRDNLRVVRPAASDADLDAVAARAGLLDTVRALPAGWSTPAGPDGAALSGGQRQRLLLARALLADPAVLVLDEPTAHLDADTERVVLTDLLGATRGRTVLLSTHRPLPEAAVDAVLRVADRTLVNA